MICKQKHCISAVFKGF